MRACPRSEFGFYQDWPSMQSNAKSRQIPAKGATQFSSFGSFWCGDLTKHALQSAVGARLILTGVHFGTDSSHFWLWRACAFSLQFSDYSFKGL